MLWHSVSGTEWEVLQGVVPFSGWDKVADATGCSLNLNVQNTPAVMRIFKPSVMLRFVVVSA